MIKCPNCGAGNLDGTLFCDQCIWDLTGVESVPDDPAAMAAPAAPAPAPSVDVSLVGDEAGAAPVAEAAPMDAMAMEAVEAAPLDEGFGEAPPDDAGLAMDAGLAEPPPADAGLAMEAGLEEAPPDEAGLAMEAGLEEAPPADAALAGDALLGEPPAEEGAPPGDAALGGDIMAIGDAGMPVSGVVPAEPVSQALVDAAPDDAVSEMAAPPSSQFRPSTIAPLAPGIPLSGAQPRLVVVRGVKTNVEYQLMEGSNFIGRFDELPVDIDLSDQEPSDKIWTSRQHACVTWDGAGLSIEDLNSSNGTYINRNKISGGEKKSLRNGDYVQVGAVLFQVKT